MSLTGAVKLVIILTIIKKIVISSRYVLIRYMITIFFEHCRITYNIGFIVSKLPSRCINENCVNEKVNIPSK